MALALQFMGKIYGKSLWENVWEKLMGKIYGENLWEKIMENINEENLWGKFLGKINGTFHHCKHIVKFFH